MLILCRRKSDGALFRPAFPDGYDAGHAIADALTGTRAWYFQRVEVQTVRRWFRTRTTYEDTGEIWQPTRGNQFDVIEV